MTNDNEKNNFSELERANIALVRRMFKEVWNSKREDLIEEFMSPDFVSHYEHETIKGIDNWKERLYKVLIKAIPDIHFEIEDIIACGEQVITRWNARGIHNGELLGVSPSGKVIEFSGMAWSKVVDGKLVSNWNNWSMSYLVKQLLTEVKVLQGILPICSFCKKIRNDKGYWDQLEKYIYEHSEAKFSHGMCDECFKKQIDEFEKSFPPK
jgi:steroid delta-isomerase-like uncharacterized protein